MKLFFKKTGEGKPLLILHGLFGMSDNWMTLSKQFAEHGFACYTVDLRNHGRSPHSETFNYQVMADDLAELMADEHISSTNIIGHSMGGKTAMFFAAAHPERTERLVVVDIAPRFYPPQHDSVMAALQNINLETISSRKEAEDHLRNTLGDEATIQFLLKNLYWSEATEKKLPVKKLAWRFNLPAIKKNIDAIGEALPAGTRFNKPVLFVRGEKSAYITKQDEADIKKHFPLSQVATVAKAGHWVHTENPTVFFDTVLEFLNRE
ncbi:MAG: alpha/beta fold hydrolase [Bacteroidetes bacterium]|nr:alpha/beta fold hydrolase [Bacteroidota bacterium]